MSNFIPFLLEPSWQNIMQEELKNPYLVHLAAFLAQERASGIPIYPQEELVFNALMQTHYTKVKVVIVGQDPYHGPGQAHGLSFSVPKGIALPPSLQNIFKELHTDLGIKLPSHGCLLNWSEQGVLLLNATLTVRNGLPLSHHNKGWERFTDAIIRELAKRKEPIIFLLWGKNAVKKCEDVPELAKHTHHTILKAAHPSPFSAHSGFFGCRHFSKTNELLTKQGLTAINWSLE